MTDIQYQLLDELYFVTPYATLANECGMQTNELSSELQNLWQKGWVRVFFPDADTELPFQQASQELSQCYFLASKAGLLAHNSL